MNILYAAQVTHSVLNSNTSLGSGIIRTLDAPRKIKFPVLFFLLFLFAARAFAPSHLPEVPEFLYHWISYENLALLAKQSTSGELPFGPIKRSTKFAALNGLENLPAYFTWSHPIGGMGTRAVEAYGQFEMYGNSEALVKIQIDPKKAKVGHVVTKSDKKVLYKGETDLDIIFHEHFDERGRVVIREWILVNDRPVVGYTADVKQLRPEV